jgi:lipocalin
LKKRNRNRKKKKKKIKMKNLLILLLIEFVSCGSLLNIFSSCPNVKSMSRFDLSKYSGDWYEIYRSIQPKDYEYGLKCIKTNFKLVDGVYYEIVNTAYS